MSDDTYDDTWDDEYEYFIDIWTGDDPGTCMRSLTGLHQVVKDPPSGLPVHPRPNELVGDCTLYTQ
ncbi:MAG TPA: hypothetical protein VK978_05195 [Candidatus Saccharimonadales bacterium]|nr:hypothetical protein [Candidatus Saccharimonadales bacterium]